MNGYSGTNPHIRPAKQQSPAHHRGLGFEMPWMVIISLGLIVFGFIVMLSASVPVSYERYEDYLYMAKMRLLWLGVCALLIALILSLPLNIWQQLDWLFLLGLVALLVLTIFFGKEVNGARRWLQIGSFSLQPSELAKLILPIYVAGYCMRRSHRGQLAWTGGMYPLIVSGVVMSLIFYQPDFGSAALLFVLVLGMLFVAGMRLSQLVLLVVVGLGVAWLLVVNSEYRMQRLQSFLDPASDPLGGSWQLMQSQIAFVRGGLAGTGLGESVQKLSLLPEAHNDYILAVVAEELGWLGVSALLAAFLGLVSRGFWLSIQFLQSGEEFEGYLMLGLSLALAGQVLVNSGMAIGLLPPKGISLPFFSTGVSNLCVTACCLGILIRGEYEIVSRRTSEVLVWSR